MILTYEELKSFCANLVITDKTCTKDFEAQVSSTCKMLDKIAKLINIDTSLHQDKLAELGGDDSPFGTTYEEWFEEMCMPQEFSASGTGALTPEDPNYRKPSYSFDLTRQKFKMTIDNYDLQQASRNPEDFARLLAMKSKKFADSEIVYRYQCKRQLLANVISLCETAMNPETTFDKDTNYNADSYVNNGSGVAGVFVKAYTGGTATDFDNAVALGYIVVLDLIKEIAKPVDTETGEAFIKQVKEDIEVARDENASHSIGGNCLGASDNLHLYFTQGIKPSLSVDVKAGTFNLSQITFDVPDSVIKDFGNASADYYAMLIDTRVAKLHNVYLATRKNENGDGDFINLFKHIKYHGHISPFGFVRIYKVVSNSNKEIVKTAKKSK